MPSCLGLCLCSCLCLGCPSLNHQSAAISAQRVGAPPGIRASFPPSIINQLAPSSGSSSRQSLLPPINLFYSSIGQPRAAGAPPGTTSSLPLYNSPAKRELILKEPPPSPSQPAPRSGTFPRKSLISSSFKQPSAAGALPERALFSLPQSISPVQQDPPPPPPPPPPKALPQ